VSLHDPRMSGDFTRSAEYQAVQAQARAEAQAALLKPLRTYEELRAAIDARRKLIGMTMADLDERSGVQSGYSAKLIAGVKNLGPMSMDCILGALGIDLVIIERRRD